MYFKSMRVICFRIDDDLDRLGRLVTIAIAEKVAPDSVGDFIHVKDLINREKARRKLRC